MIKIAITGGSGTLGKELVKQLGERERIVILSRNEYNQAVMKKQYPEGGSTGLRYMIGDVRDLDRLKYAFRDIDTVIHCAALKHIDICEYNVFECVENNVIGSMNVVKACVSCDVKKAILVSTDKECLSISAYGSSKALAERVFIGANNMGKTNFATTRYGNVAYSKGSCFEFWEKLAEQGKPIPVTNDKMTRFFWSIGDAGNFILNRLAHQDRGVIYVPKMNSFKMIDLAKKYSDNIKIIGNRSPEKLHEDLINEVESYHTYDCGDYYAIYPLDHQWSKNIKPVGKKVPEGFKMTSEIAHE